MNSLILKPEIQEYLREHLHSDAAALALKGSPFEGVTASELAQQLTGLQKTEKKLPTWHKTSGIFFPPKLNLEQTSSEETAVYKASLFSDNSIIDLTGGFGVDVVAFSKTFNEVYYCELNDDLASIAQHNFKILGSDSIQVQTTDSVDFISKISKTFDLIYADPSRRHESKGKVFMLADCEPNIPRHLDLIFSKAKRAMIKTSPLLDIQAAALELKHVAEVHAVALKNEVKELLFVLEPQANSRDYNKIAINLNSDYSEAVQIQADEENAGEPEFDGPRSYLYEPNAALMKLGVFNWISNKYKLAKLASNTHLYTADEAIEFPGRRFKIGRSYPYSKKVLAKEFKGKKAHITTRNFRESVAAIRAKLKIQDGGETYLFFTTLQDGKSIVLECEKA